MNVSQGSVKRRVLQLSDSRNWLSTRYSLGEGSDSQFQTVLAHSPGLKGAPCAPGTVAFFPLIYRSQAGQLEGVFLHAPQPCCWQRHNSRMPTNALLPLLQQRLPGLLAVYAFGSRVKQGGAQARADSDLDLAVLVEGRADPVLLIELMGELTDVVGCPVDLLDLRAASTVMQHQVLTSGTQLWAKDIQADLFAAAMLTEKLWFDARRAPLVQDVMERGSVYGR